MGALFFILFGWLLYFLLFGILIKNPQYSILSFILISLFFPRSGNDWLIFKIEEVSSISLAIILQSIAIFTVGFRLVCNKSWHTLIPRRIANICLLASFCVILSSSFSYLMYLVDSFYGVKIVADDLAWDIPLLNATIFLYGCSAYLYNRRSIEIVLIIFILSGIEISLESIVYSFLKLPLPLSQYVIHEQGRFMGFFLRDYTAIAQIVISAIGCLLYFAITRKKNIYYFLIPLFFFPMIATYQRTNFVSGLIVIFTMLILFSSIKGNIRLRKTMLLLVMTIAITFPLLSNDYLLELIGDERLMTIYTLFQGDIRPDYFNSYFESWISRIGAHVRALDVIAISFPLGVGPGKVNFLMSSPSVPEIFKFILPSHESGAAELFYTQISTGSHVTGPHNFYLNIVAEYGLCGLLFIGYCIWGYVSSLRQLLSTKLSQLGNETYSYHMKVLSVSVMSALIFFFFFYHSVVYFILMFFYYLMFFKSDKMLHIKTNHFSNNCPIASMQ